MLHCHLRPHVPPVVLDFNHKTHNAPGYQISAKLSTAWLGYWWLNKFSRPVFQRAPNKSLISGVKWTQLHQILGGYRTIITALHVIKRGEFCPSVRLSVCSSVCHTRDPWQNGREICPDFYTIRKNVYPSFLRRRMVGGGRPLLPEILGQPTPVGAKSPIFNQ